MSHSIPYTGTWHCAALHIQSIICFVCAYAICSVVNWFVGLACNQRRRADARRKPSRACFAIIVCFLNSLLLRHFSHNTTFNRHFPNNTQYNAKSYKNIAASGAPILPTLTQSKNQILDGVAQLRFTYRKVTTLYRRLVQR